MLAWIEHRLKTYEKTGELADMQARFKEVVTQKVKRPEPVNISTTTSPKTFRVDPSLTLAADIKDQSGNIIYKKGLRINPFDTKTWPSMGTTGEKER